MSTTSWCSPRDTSNFATVKPTPTWQNSAAKYPMTKLSALWAKTTWLKMQMNNTRTNSAPSSAATVGTWCKKAAVGHATYTPDTRRGVDRRGKLTAKRGKITPELAAPPVTKTQTFNYIPCNWIHLTSFKSLPLICIPNRRSIEGAVGEKITQSCRPSTDTGEAEYTLGQVSQVSTSRACYNDVGR